MHSEATIAKIEERYIEALESGYDSTIEHWARRLEDAVALNARLPVWIPA